MLLQTGVYFMTHNPSSMNKPMLMAPASTNVWYEFTSSGILCTNHINCHDQLCVNLDTGELTPQIRFKRYDKKWGCPNKKSSPIHMNRDSMEDVKKWRQEMSEKVARYIKMDYAIVTG